MHLTVAGSQNWGSWRGDGLDEGTAAGGRAEPDRPQLPPHRRADHRARRRAGRAPGNVLDIPVRSVDQLMPKWQRRVWDSVRRIAFGLITLLLIEYLVLPQLAGARKSLHLLSKVNFAYLVAGLALEGGAIVAY